MICTENFPLAAGVPGSAPARRSDLELALRELFAAVGEDHVHVDAATRQHWGRSTLPHGTLPSAVVQPASTEEVQQLVRIAGRHRLALHPISCGKNWGYSDACAALDGQIILDLRRMNRILEVNEELAYATIEPGVTQGQMAAYLVERKLPLWVDATGAGPDASIVGNTLERGFGHTVNGDRFLNCCGLEVVLADGRLLKTGFGHYQNAQAAAVFKWGIGPYLDGLFTQSNVGIVTRMTFWLIPRPECFRAFLLSLRNPEDIGLLIEALRPLRLRGTLPTPVHLFNDYRLVAGTEPYPWEEMHGRTPLSAEIFERMKARYGIQGWHGTGALQGSRAEVAAAAREVKKALRKVPGLSVLFLDDRRLRIGAAAARWLGKFAFGQKLGRRIEKARVIYDLLQGKPSAACLQGASWRARPVPGGSSDPLDRNAGMLWISPILPMTRAHVERVTALTRPLFDRYGFEYQVTLSLVNARSVCAVLTIAYDKTDAEERGRAGQCYAEVMEALFQSGYIPYRAGNLSMADLDATSDVFWEVAASLKTALDPQGILSPGHYEPARARP